MRLSIYISLSDIYRKLYMYILSVSARHTQIHLTDQTFGNINIYPVVLLSISMTIMIIIIITIVYYISIINFHKSCYTETKQKKNCIR